MAKTKNTGRMKVESVDCEGIATLMMVVTKEGDKCKVKVLTFGIGEYAELVENIAKDLRNNPAFNQS